LGIENTLGNWSFFLNWLGNMPHHNSLASPKIKTGLLEGVLQPALIASDAAKKRVI
jgi:hypothetical protein